MNELCAAGCISDILNFDGIIVGAATLFIIWIFHPIVIKSEERFTKKVWPAFLLAGIASAMLSLYTGRLLSPILGVLSVTCLWCIIELDELDKKRARQ